MMLPTIRPEPELLATPASDLTDADVADLLAMARNRISDPGRWGKHSLASNAGGDAVDPLNPEACSFCTIGAIASLSVPEGVEYRLRAELCTEAVIQLKSQPRPASILVWSNEAAVEQFPQLTDGQIYDRITDWNDHPDVRHEDILAGFDAAIARLCGDDPL